MKGKNIFTKSEIDELKQLINKRVIANKSKQKTIRSRIRAIGFFGRDDFDIINLQLLDLENLIKNRQIKIIDEIAPNIEKVKVKKDIKQRKISGGSVDVSLNNFSIFNPLSDDASIIPNSPGNYIVCLNKNSFLPKTNYNYQTQKFEKLEILYTGVATKNLRKRDYRQHFIGNSGSSTLRKSIGSLFEYKHIARDKDSSNGKTKFSEDDEKALSKWMKENLKLFFYENDTPSSYEEKLISKLNPPLNLLKNKNNINREFRQELSRLRNIKLKKSKL